MKVAHGGDLYPLGANHFQVMRLPVQREKETSLS
jgi:hypothetical protein